MGEATAEGRGGPEARVEERDPQREGAKAVGPVPTVRGGAEEDVVFGGEVRREAAEGGRAAAQTGVRNDDEGRRHVVVLTPEAGKCIGVRACEGNEHTVVSPKAARLFGSERVMLTRTVQVMGPSGIPIRVEETCTIVSPYGLLSEPPATGS